MSRVRLALLAVLAGSVLLPRVGLCQTDSTQTAPTQPPPALPPPTQPPPTEVAPTEPPPAPRTLEMQLGVAGVTLPEESNGLCSAEPELRLGWFIRQDVEFQAQGDIRAWPLGTVAAKSYGVSGNLLWFPPKLGGDRHDFYFLGGAGGAYTDPPDPDESSSFDPIVRVGVGVKAPLAGLSPSLGSLFFNAEFKEQATFADELDFLSGISIGVCKFR